ncbi:transporter [bacterium]|nr:MAG: transporter [bacterium]
MCGKQWNFSASFLKRGILEAVLTISAIMLIPFRSFACSYCYVSPGAMTAEEGESISSGAMLNSPTASTMQKGRSAAGFTYGYARYNAMPAEDAHMLHEEGRDIHGKRYENSYHLYFDYGVMDDLDVYFIAPYVSSALAQVHDEDNIGRKERAFGFGDASLMGKYRFWKKYFEAALIAGVKFPTGETSLKDKSQNKFAPEQQPGSGSWDGELGIALSRSFQRRFSLSGSFQYILKGEGSQDFKAGDILRFSLGSSVSLRRPGEYPNLSLSLELNNEWVGRDHSGEEDKVFDSGGTTLFVTPGLNVNIARNLSVFLGAPVPVHQNLGGEHEETKYKLLTGASVYF